MDVALSVPPPFGLPHFYHPLQLGYIMDFIQLHCSTTNCVFKHGRVNIIF